LSMDEELNEALDLYVGLAPAMRPKPIANAKVNFMINYFSPSVLFTILGTTSFLPFAETVRKTLGAAPYATMVQGALEILFGWKCDKWPAHWRPALYSHLFSHASMRCVVHWFQIITSGVFAHYDHTISARSSLPIPSLPALPALPSLSSFTFFTPTTPATTTTAAPTPIVNNAPPRPPVAYPTQHIKTKTVLFAGGNDNISDVEHLREMLPREVVIDAVEDYEHMDFLWAPSAKELVWDRIIEMIRNENGQQ